MSKFDRKLKYTATSKISFSTLGPRSAGYPKAALEGVTVRHVSDSRARAAWNDYRTLGREILELLKSLEAIPA